MYLSGRIRSRLPGGLWRSAAAFLIVLVALAGTLVAASAQTATIVRVEDTEIDADGSGAVPISLEGSPGIVAMHLEITYDPDVLEWEALEQGELLAGGALLEANADQPGRVVIGFATLDGASGDGELILANFVSTGAEETTTLGLENVQAWDANGFDVLIDAQAGEVSIGSGFPLWLLLLIVAILILLFLIVVGLLIWFLRRRSRSNEETAVQPAVPSAPASTLQPPVQAQPRGDGSQARARFCSSCGQPLAEGAVFCSNCGTQVPGAGSSSQ